MTNYKTKALDEEEYSKWNEIVENSSEGTIFHTSDWMEASGKNFDIIVSLKGEEITAGIPIAYDHFFGFSVLYNPRLTPYGGPIFKNRGSKYVTGLSTQADSLEVLIEELKERFDLITYLGFSPNMNDLRSFIWNNFSTHIKYTYILQLNNKVLESMDKKRRNDIEKGREEDIFIETGNNLDVVLNLVKKTFERKNENKKFESYKSYAKRYNEMLEKKNRAKTFVAREKGEPTAGVYVTWDNKRAYQLLSGFNPDKADRSANPLAIWKSIEYTRDKLGLNYYDFEGSLLKGVENYYRSFGGELTPYYTVDWSKYSILSWMSRRDIVRNLLSGYL